MKTYEAETLLAELEREPDSVQPHYAELEHLIATCMDEVFKLSKTGTDDDRKVKRAAVEYRAGWRWNGSGNWG